MLASIGPTGGLERSQEAVTRSVDLCAAVASQFLGT